jgi:hypothetical protein
VSSKNVLVAILLWRLSSNAGVLGASKSNLRLCATLKPQTSKGLGTRLRAPAQSYVPAGITCVGGCQQLFNVLGASALVSTQ